jgi:arabinan endo-1,5-alpha-L-arabinosidase
MHRVMTQPHRSDPPAGHYRNPVHDGYFADPFVLRTDGPGSPGYVAYGTGTRHGALVFEALVSADLMTWESAGGVLEPLPDEAGSDYWAPEVAEHDGRWWMYYSVGHGDDGHSLRVASADGPLGPFTDCGVDLTPHERFAIDPHPFRDSDGTWYLFHARDVLDGPRVGTMLAVDVLETMTSLRGDPRTVLQPSDDWQIYQRRREIHGGVYDWHTLEGPFVVRHDGRYYCFYSGGSWQGEGYGMGYAVADHPLGPWTEVVTTDRWLATVPDRVLGPGHACVVRGPTGGDVLVYHAWDPGMTARRMCIDPIHWGDRGPSVDGPTWDPVALDRPASPPPAG